MFIIATDINPFSISLSVLQIACKNDNEWGRMNEWTNGKLKILAKLWDTCEMWCAQGSLKSVVQLFCYRALFICNGWDSKMPWMHHVVTAQHSTKDMTVMWVGWFPPRQTISSCYRITSKTNYQRGVIHLSAQHHRQIMINVILLFALT